MSQFWSAWSATSGMYSNNCICFLDEFCLEIHMHHQHSAFTVSSGLRAQLCGPEELTIIFTNTNGLAKRHLPVLVEGGFISLNANLMEEPTQTFPLYMYKGKRFLCPPDEE